jgi:hypothetical protein
MTLSAVLTALDREPIAHAGKLLLRAADAALDGARGNSAPSSRNFCSDSVTARAPRKNRRSQLYR